METLFKCPTCAKFLPTAQGLKAHTTRKHKQEVLSQTTTKSVDGPEPPAATPHPTGPTLDNLLEDLKAFRAASKTLRRIPKGARNFAAGTLADAIDLCVHDNSTAAWLNLFRFSCTALRVPPHSPPGTGVSLATHVNRNVELFRQGDFGAPPPPSGRVLASTRRGDAAASSPPIKLVEAKISDGDISGAVRLLCSETPLAPFDDETFSALKAKHPPPPQGQTPPLNPSTPEETLTPVSVEATRKAISSFPSGSAGGLDLLRPQHLKDLTSHSAGVAGERLLASLSEICTLILKGQTPEPIAPFLFGASLFALSKVGGGIRPIAVGNTLRRLAAKLSCARITAQLGSRFKPVQLGFGARGGAEAAAHAARRYVSFPHPTPKVLLKLDFVNAFNTIRRDVMLQEVKQAIPELYPFIAQCYGSPSLLVFGQDTIPSACGIQQGDPLGPALFCLVVHPLASSLTSELNIWYLDDASLGGSADDVMADFLLIREESHKLGLELNMSKCELFTLNGDPDHRIQESFREAAPGIRFPHEEDCTLLGAPLKEEAIEKLLLAKIQDLSRLTGRLTFLSAHHAFFMLKNALAIPKLTFLLRCAPGWKAQAMLVRFDEALRDATESVFNIKLSDLAKDQIHLPVAEGGLGLRKASALAISAFISSVHSVLPLTNDILPRLIAGKEDILLIEGIRLWEQETGIELPPPEERTTQRAWDKGVVTKTKENLQERATTLIDKARLLGVASKASGAFLNAIPSACLGTLLDNNSFRVAIGLRLGLEICQPHVCICGTPVDKTGTHGLNCKKSAGRQARHASVNDILKRGLASANFPVTLEPSFLDNASDIRPDGITLTPWETGRSLAWDFTCVNSLAPSYLPTSAGTPRVTANTAEARKREKYAPLGNRFHFIPVAAECLGSFGNEGQKLVTAIGRKIGEATGERRATEYLLQRLSVAIQRGNAASIIGTTPKGPSLGNELCMLARPHVNSE